MSELLSATSNHLRNVEELYCGHHGWLYARLRKKLGNAMDAADLVQDTFARILASNVGVFEEPRAYLVRRAFLLSQIGGMKYEAIAEQIGVLLITVKRYMKQAFLQCLTLVQ